MMSRLIFCFIILFFSSSLSFAQDTTFLEKEIYFLELEGLRQWGISKKGGQGKGVLSPAVFDTVENYFYKNGMAYYRVRIGKDLGTYFAQKDTLKALSGIALQLNLDVKTDGEGRVFENDGIYSETKGQKTRWGFYDPSTKKIESAAVYDSLIYFFWHGPDLGFYKAKSEDKWGLFTQTKVELLPLEFQQIYFNLRSATYRLDVKKENKWGVYRLGGEVLLPIKFDEILSDGFAFKLRIGEKYGIYDMEGKEVIPVCYENIVSHNNVVRSLVLQKDKWAVFEWLEDACLPEEKEQYDRIGYFLTWYMVKKGDKYGLVDRENKEILAIDYERIDVFYQKYLSTLIVKKDGEYGLLRIDSMGKKITEIPIEYDEIWLEERTLKIKVRKSKYIDYYYEDAPYFEMKYNDVVFHENIEMFAIKKGNKWGLATANQEITTPPIYSKIHVIDKDNFMVQKGGKWGVINHRNRAKIPIIFDDFEYVPEWKSFFAFRKGKIGIASLTRGVMLEPDFDEVIVMNAQNYLVRQGKNWGIVAPGGRVILPLEYMRYKYKPEKNEILFVHPNGSTKPFKLLN